MQVVVSYQLSLLVLKDCLHVVEVATLVNRGAAVKIGALHRDLAVLHTIMRHRPGLVVKFLAATAAATAISV